MTDYADLVNGLKERAEHAAQEGDMTATCDARYFSQAADAIEALVKGTAKLKEALTKIADSAPIEFVEIAERALEGK